MTSDGSHGDARPARNGLEAVSRLAAGVAHDMNNLLGAIMSHASVLRGEIPAARHQRDLEAILAAARRGRELMETLRSFSPEQSPTRTIVDLDELALEGHELLRQAFPAQLRLRLELARGKALVHGDRQQLGAAVAHLCSNAAQACTQAGRGMVCIRVVHRELDRRQASELDLEPGSYHLLEVEDDGPGMERELMGRAFDPYFTTRDGAGLGLTLVWGTARSHHGTATLDTAPAGGVCARLVLPAHEPTAPGDSPAPPSVRLSAPPPAITPTSSDSDGTVISDAARPRRVLVVDDDRMMLTASRRALRSLGFEVTLAEDGVAALELLELDAAYEAVLLDVIMPRLDGGQVLRRLRARGCTTPVLLCSGYSADAVDSELLAEPFVDFLRKPFSVSELSRALSRLIDAGDPALYG